MNYLNNYRKLIEKAKFRKIEIYSSENHHVIPCSIFNNIFSKILTEKSILYVEDKENKVSGKDWTFLGESNDK